MSLRARFRQFLPIIVAIAAPSVVTVLSVRALTGAHLLDFRPLLNDEVYYWHQTATAAAAGTAGGYYTVDERTPAVEAFRFGPHGPVYPLVTGIIARITGWHRASGPLFNLAWMAACAAMFFALARPALPRAWLIAAVLATFWPVPFWAASNMQESFHHGVALLLAGACAGLAHRTRAAVIVAALVLPIAILVRPSWGVMLPAFGLIAVDRIRASAARTPTARDVAAVFAGSAVVLAALVAVYARTRAPMPAAFEFLRLASVSSGVGPILSNARDNLARLTDLSDQYDPLEIVHRAEYLALIAALAVAMLRRQADDRTRVQVGAQWLQLTAIAAAMILFYTLTNWTEHRILSAHVLLALLVLSVLPGRLAPGIAAALVAINLLATPVYVESFRQNRTSNFQWDRRPLRVFEETIEGRVRYTPGASPWCNTILSSQYPPDFVALPAGIGISITRNSAEMAAPPRSRYLLLDGNARATLGGTVRLQQIGAPLPYGTLYLNLDARCP